MLIEESLPMHRIPDFLRRDLADGGLFYLSFQKKITIMKKSFYNLSFSAVILLAALGFANDKLTGHWLVQTGEGPANVDFASDGTFKVLANGQTVNEGKYKLVVDTFFMTDNNCGSQGEGKYKLTFHTPDSVSFKSITDPCSERMQQVDGVSMTRIKDALK
jgi:hypothetical protein